MLEGRGNEDCNDKYEAKKFYVPFLYFSIYVCTTLYTSYRDLGPIYSSQQYMIHTADLVA